MEKTERYFLIEEMTIIVANSQEQAETYYQNEYDNEWEKGQVEEIQDDYIVGGVQNINGHGYDEIHLFGVLENKPLPYAVNVELI